MLKQSRKVSCNKKRPFLLLNWKNSSLQKQLLLVKQLKNREKLQLRMTGNRGFKLNYLQSKVKKNSNYSKNILKKGKNF